MNKKNNNFKFKKENILDFDKDQVQSINTNDRIKLKIMEKYNLSSQEADKIVSKINKKMNVNKDSKDVFSANYQLNSDLNEGIVTKQRLESIEIDSQHILDDDNDIINNKSKNHLVPKSQEKNKNEVNLKNEYQSGKNLTVKENIPSNNELDKSIINSQNEVIDLSFNKNIFKKENNVDAILEDILPDYNQQVSIDVNHVDLTFEVQNEKIDTLKEAAIRTLKRDNSKKIKIHALKDVSFQIYKGEKVGIIGYNGASKSTLLNVITGIYIPDKGNVTTHGRISPLLSLGAGFDTNSSGRENIMLNGAILGYEKDYLESKMDEIIEFSELGEFIDIPIKNYSSGMLAKLGFSIATSVNPDILIIDEILGVGDVNFVKKSFDKIRSLMDGGTTVLIVSHSIPKIRELCDKAIWMDNGSLKAFGEVNKICDEYLKDAEKASREQLANIRLVE